MKNNAVYLMRWEKIKEAMSEVDLEGLEAEVLWDKEVVNKIKPLKLCVSKLNRYVSQFLRPYNERAIVKDMDAIIYDLPIEGEINKFSKEIDTAVDDIGLFLKQKYGYSR
jgi:hypothetical protein